jgi:hypothetical protein
MADAEHIQRILEERARARAAAEPSSPVRRTDEPGDLVFKTTENAQVEPAKAEVLEPRTGNNLITEADLERRLEIERELLTEVIAMVRAEVRRSVEQLNAERGADRDAQINQEFVKIWRSLEQATKSIVEIRREQLERTLHSSELDPKAMKH